MILCDTDEEGEPSALVGRSDVASPPGGDEGEAKVGEQGSSVFNRLETTRTMLEMELGLAPMLQAYQLVQVSSILCTLALALLFHTTSIDFL